MQSYLNLTDILVFAILFKVNGYVTGARRIPRQSRFHSASEVIKLASHKCFSGSFVVSGALFNAIISVAISIEDRIDNRIAEGEVIFLRSSRC